MQLPSARQCVYHCDLQALNHLSAPHRSRIAHMQALQRCRGSFVIAAATPVRKCHASSRASMYIRTLLLCIIASLSRQAGSVTASSALCDAQRLCTCYNTVNPPACYSPDVYHCVGTNRLVPGPEPSSTCAIPTTSGPSLLPSPSPSSQSPVPAPTAAQPSQLCNAQNLCTCYNTVNPPACYSPAIFRCEGTNRLVSGPEPTGACAISTSPTPSPVPSPSPKPSPSPVLQPSPSPSPPAVPVVQPSPLCNAQNLCTCYNTVNPPACYSPAIFRCEGTNRLVSGPEPTGACAISTSQTPSPVPSPSPKPSPILQPSPSPPAVPVAQPSPLCNAQNLCTCYNTVNPPACYSPAIFRCEGTNRLVSGPEPTGACAIKTSNSSSPIPGSPSPLPSPMLPSPRPPVPSPSPAPPPSPVTPGECAAPASGIRVAPASGTLPATRPPFGFADNQFTARLQRMPSSAADDPAGLLQRPFPTSAWFTNFLWSPAGNPTSGEDPVQVFPYHVRVRGPPNPNTAAADRGLWFNKPAYSGDQIGGVVFETFPELQLTLKELQETASPAVKVLDWDDLSVTINFAARPSGPSMNFPLVKGSPYLTARIPEAARPVLRAPQGSSGGSTISRVDRVGANKLKVISGQVPFDGQHTWFLWASRAINYQISGSEVLITDQASTAGTFAGVLRVAWAPSANAAGAAAIEAMLDAHVDAVPVGGSVNVWSNIEQGSGSYSMAWSTQSMSGAAAPTQELLMLALPHHIDTLASPAVSVASTGLNTPFPLGVAAAGSSVALTGGSVAYISKPQMPGSSSRTYGAYVMSVRGPMVPIAGFCWLLQEQLGPLTSEVEAAASLKNPLWRTDIEQTLLADLPLVLPPASLPAGDWFADWPTGPRSWPWKGMQNVDAYFGGSELQGMARLIYIAKALEATAPAAGSTFGLTAAQAATNTTNALKALLLKRLTLPCTFSVPGGGANPGSLCYDNVFKLVTTARAQSQPNDDGVDFFSRTGTDHHFHWGYWVSAAAAVASQDLAWYKANIEPYVNALVRDYANCNKDDPFFPYARHKDWYMAHSWAAGLQASFDGKNQESSSEAVNAYLAIAVLGQATGNAALEGWGRLLLATEITAARKYTQVYSGNDIYSLIASGSTNNGITRAKVATILFASKASAFNWFDPDILTRHGIQWMPFTPVSDQLLPVEWIAESYDLVAANTKIPTDRFWSPSDGGGGAMLGWRVLLTMARSMIPGQQTAAWNALNALPINGAGGYALCGTIGRLTRTAAKWWIATRP